MSYDSDETDCLDMPVNEPTKPKSPPRKHPAYKSPNGMLARGTVESLKKYPRKAAVDGAYPGMIKPEDAVKVISRRYTAMAFHTLAKICEQGKNEAARVSAAREILDRAWGKSHIMTEAETKPGSNIHVHFGERPSVTVLESRADETDERDDDEAGE